MAGSEYLIHQGEIFISTGFKKSYSLNYLGPLPFYEHKIVRVTFLGCNSFSSQIVEGEISCKYFTGVNCITLLWTFQNYFCLPNQSGRRNIRTYVRKSAVNPNFFRESLKIILPLVQPHKTFPRQDTLYEESYWVMVTDFRRHRSLWILFLKDLNVFCLNSSLPPFSSAASILKSKVCEISAII